MQQYSVNQATHTRMHAHNTTHTHVHTYLAVIARTELEPVHSSVCDDVSVASQLNPAHHLESPLAYANLSEDSAKLIVIAPNQTLRNLAGSDWVGVGGFV